MAGKKKKQESGVRSQKSEERKQESGKTKNIDIWGFILARCTISLFGEILVTALYDAYREYCAGKDEKPVAIHVFSKAVETTGPVKKIRKKDRRMYFSNIELLPGGIDRENLANVSNDVKVKDYDEEFKSESSEAQSSRPTENTQLEKAAIKDLEERICGMTQGTTSIGSGLAGSSDVKIRGPIDALINEIEAVVNGLRCEVEILHDRLDMVCVIDDCSGPYPDDYSTQPIDDNRSVVFQKLNVIFEKGKWIGAALERLQDGLEIG